jgi:HTH-type transcriptional regulator/antitoxin HigA
VYNVIKPEAGRSLPRTPEFGAVEVPAVLVEDYERRLLPMEEPDPIEAIRFLMEQANLTQADLVPIH